MQKHQKAESSVKERLGGRSLCSQAHSYSIKVSYPDPQGPRCAAKNENQAPTRKCKGEASSAWQVQQNTGTCSSKCVVRLICLLGKPDGAGVEVSTEKKSHGKIYGLKPRERGSAEGVL